MRRPSRIALLISILLPSLSRVMNAGIGEGRTIPPHRAWSDQLYAIYAAGREARFTAAISVLGATL